MPAQPAAACSGWDLPKQLVPDVKGDRQQVKDQMKRFRDWGLARLKQKGIDSAEKVRALTLEDCKAVAALLAAKATPQEANEYRKWALSVAEEVPESWTNKIATS